MNGMSINWPFFFDCRRTSGNFLHWPLTSLLGQCACNEKEMVEPSKTWPSFWLEKKFLYFFFLISQTARRIGRKAGSVQSLARRREIAAECSSKRNSPFPFLFGPLQFFGWIMTRQFHLHFVREAFSLSATWEQTTPRENASTFFRSAN